MANPSLAKWRKLQENAQALLHENTLPVAEDANLAMGQRFLLFCAHVYHGFIRNRCPVRAAALAFTNLLALVPLLAVAVSVSAGLLKSKGEQTIQDFIREAIIKVAPTLGLKEAGSDTLDTVVSQISSFVANFQSGKLGVSAVLALIFVALSLLATIESAFNDIWGVTRGRGWFARVVQYWAGLTLGPLFLISALTLLTWVSVGRNLAIGGFIGKFLGPVVILALGSSLLYLIMPNTKVHWRAALLGGSVAGILLQLNSWFNVMYVSRVVTYKQLYGSMAALPLFLLGLYFSWLLVLLGAQVAYTYQHRRTNLQERMAESVSQRGREFAAVHLMTRIGRQFLHGNRPATSSEIAEELGIPFRLTCKVLASLERAGLIVEVATADDAFTPTRPLSQITVADILRALREGPSPELNSSRDPAHPVVREQFEMIEQAWQRAAQSLTLEDLVHRVPSTKSTEPAPA